VTDPLRNDIVDCIVIGGGPAGLTAAIYLARYHLTVSVFDDLTSRAATIPISHNHAGFPEGISGKDLLARMRAQAVQYGTDVRHHRVASLIKDRGTFIARYDHGELRARSVLIATGVVNHRPEMPAQQHDQAVASGLIRYCPVCDGYEITDRRVGVIGRGTSAFKEALFLRSFTRDITIISPGDDHGLSCEELGRLKDASIRTLTGPVLSVELSEDSIDIVMREERLSFASIYPALGSDIRSSLVEGLGAKRSEDGCILVDSHQRTSVSGLYAAGDVVIGLDQISHAMGQAGVAATAIRNDLGEMKTRLR